MSLSSVLVLRSAVFAEYIHYPHRPALLHFLYSPSLSQTGTRCRTRVRPLMSGVWDCQGRGREPGQAAGEKLNAADHGKEEAGGDAVSENSLCGNEVIDEKLTIFLLSTILVKITHISKWHSRLLLFILWAQSAGHLFCNSKVFTVPVLIVLAVTVPKDDLLLLALLFPKLKKRHTKNTERMLRMRKLSRKSQRCQS